MKILHTADWHLGQTFFQYDRQKEHEVFLDWLLEQIRQREVDVLLVAGDVFDTANPSSAAQRLYFGFITRLVRDCPDVQVIITGGNHDSYSRLEAPRDLLEAMQVSVRGGVGGMDRLDDLIIPLKKGGVCLAVPYIRQSDLSSGLAYAEGVRLIYSELIARAKAIGGPIVAMGHLLATGAELSSTDERTRSERSIVGGLEGVGPDIFDGADYVALGHLHKAQRVSGCDNVRYSGAPLPMSFAERNNRQGVVLVNTDEGLSVEKIEFDAPVKLLRIPSGEPLLKTEVISQILNLPSGPIGDDSPYLEVNVLITQPEPMLKEEIGKALEGKAVRLARVGTISRGDEGQERVISSVDELIQMCPMDVAQDVFMKKFGGEAMPAEMVQMLNEIIEEVK